MVEVSYSDDKVKITDVIKKYVSEDIKDYTLNFECKQVINKINRFKNLAKLNDVSIY